MKKYDVLVVGASTTGCWFANQMAKQGFKVLVIEKQEADNVSREYDVFHMGKEDMEKFQMLMPDEDSPLREFCFAHSTMVSPYGNYPKDCAEAPVIGLHKHDYIMEMAKEAKKNGADIVYGASFEDLIFDDRGRVIGGKYSTKKGVKEAYARIVADCSGIPAVARTKLPDSSVVGNFKLTPKDILYVVLYYAEYLNKNFNPRDLDGFFMQYKSWSAPSDNPNGAILGIGAFCSYDYAEWVFKNHFMQNTNFPEYTVERIEKGMTPYHTSVYSLVDDGFIVLGDAACHTKPTCGEGCTSSLVAGEIAVEVISNLLKSDKFLTKERMWSINKRYMVAQGKDFDSMRPLLMGVISMDYDEAEYLFENDVIFCEKILGGMDTGLNLTGEDIANIVKGVVKGIAKKKIKPETIGKLLKGMAQSAQVGALYDDYPAHYENFAEWKQKADKMWESIGPVAATCDPEILKEIGFEE